MATLTFESAEWSDKAGYRGYDVHLVRQAGASNTTGALLPLLRLVFQEDTGATDPEDADHKLPKSGFTVTFTATVPKPAQGYPSQFDFDLDPDDGTVTALPVSTTKIVRNFIVIATVKETATVKTATVKIRVHLHPGIAGAHLQPRGLHLRQNTTAHFSVLAEFTDDTVADVSYHGISFSVVDGPLTLLPSNFFTPTASSGTGHIRAQLPASLGGLTTAPTGTSQDGEVNVLPGWDALPVPAGSPPGFDPYLAERIEPGPGTLQRNEPDVKNVIFLPEGFTSGQQKLFEALADGLVKNELATSNLYRPFDLLKERINYYRLWIEPAGDEGITELNDLAPLAGSTGPGPHATLVPTPNEPPATGIESLDQLIFKVGQPTPNDPIAADVAQQIDDWNTTYGTDFVTFGSGIDQAELFNQWKNLQHYGVVLESDTLFGLAAGERPQVDHDSESEYIGFHPFRFKRAEIDVLLTNIKARDEHLKTAVNIGAELWAGDTAKNASLVVFICLGGRSIGTHWPDAENDKTQAAITMTDADEPAVSQVIGVGNNFYQELADVPTLRKRQNRIKVPKSQVAVLAHEIAHDMNIGEEYTFKQQFIPASQKAEIDDEWNLQVADELDSTDAGVLIHDERIRWRLPRVLKAGFMSGRLESDGADWKVQMRVTYGQDFKEGDKVRFRDPRLLLKTSLGAGLPDIMKFQPPDHLLQVKKRLDGDDPDLVRLQVLSVPGLPPFQNLSQPGFILYQPMLDGNDDQLIVHKAVLAHLRTDGPLSRPAKTATCTVTAGSDNAPQTPQHLPPELDKDKLEKPIRNKKRLLGLYDGGENFRCGIYHAAGECMMRRYALIIRPKGIRKRGTFKGQQKVKVKVTRFCHVCRYIMVDKLDPRKHAEINGSLEYPQPKTTP